MNFDWKTTGKLILVCAVLILILVMLTSGCITTAKNVGKEIMATPTPTPTPIPTPTPTPTPTPKQTPKAIETLAAHYVDPFMTGERWEGQWFKWKRLDVEGLKDLEAGILVYRHGFMDHYTWYNNAMGNYQVQEPSAGNRYFVVWIHEEILTTNKSAVTSLWIIDETAFRIQIGDQLYEVDTVHNPVNRIREFDTKWDYYNIVRADPFGWKLIRSLTHPESGGYYAQRIGWIRAGPGNAADGYILFEIPEKTMEEDILLLGSFSQFGSAYWRFTT